jgi:pyruvate dehydrogenase E2 component (dihydrolipoamide acetyltransferase)
MRQVFLLPDVGEGLADGEVLRWLVDVGDEVVVNQPLVEVETAKAAVELPSPFAGVVAELRAAVGDVVAVGAPLISIDTGGGAADEAAPVADTATEPAAAAETIAEPIAESADEGSGPLLVGYGVVGSGTRRRRRLGQAVRTDQPVRHGGAEVAAAAARHVERVRAKPPVRRRAKELGVDLDSVTPTGPEGSVTREDVEAAAGGSDEAPSIAEPITKPAPTQPPVPVTRDEPLIGTISAVPERRIPVRGVQRRMAEAMVQSAFTIPHVTEWVEVDVTRSTKLLRRLRETPGFTGHHVTPLLLVARACLQAVRRTPEVNAYFDADAAEVVVRDEVNLGIAVAGPRGLVVPHVPRADRLSLPELAAALDDLVRAARDDRLTPAQLSGSTFTITNIGVFGVDGGTPLINPGEAAILAAGAWRERAWVHKGKVRPRIVAQLTLSFDHRFIDGARGSRFLADVAALLADPALGSTF